MKLILDYNINNKKFKKTKAKNQKTYPPVLGPVSWTRPPGISS